VLGVGLYGGDLVSTIAVPLNTWTYVYAKYESGVTMVGKINATGHYNTSYSRSINTGTVNMPTLRQKILNHDASAWFNGKS